VVDGLGVATIQIPFYLTRRELWSLQDKDVSGGPWAMEADVLLKKWVQRGLTQAVLEAIRTQVFQCSRPSAVTRRRHERAPNRERGDPSPTVVPGG